MNQENKICQNCKQRFTIEPEDFDFYKKINVPAPTWCPICRFQRRFAFRNEHFLYKRKSDFSGEMIFSQLSPDVPMKVYELEVWNSDRWDLMDYGRNIDFTRPFLQQILELWHDAPWRAKSVINPVASDYSNQCTGFKNCYLCFNGNYSEDSAYSNGIDYSKSCFDNSHISHSELCYEGFWLTRCNKVICSENCEDCFDIYFSKNLRGCSNCFGCVNMRNKSYCIFNKQYTKEEYGEEIKKIFSGSWDLYEENRIKSMDFWFQFPVKFMEGTKNVNITGDYINQSKNVKDSFLIRDGEDVKYCQYLQAGPNKDCYDLSTFKGNELVYESSQTGDGAYNIKFCFQCWTNVKNLQYCASCISTSDCFGCFGLRNKQYCILNKQYTKEEYDVLVEKLIRQMNDVSYKDKMGKDYRYGEFFPAEFSPLGYNETPDQEHLPLTMEEARGGGFNWHLVDTKNYSITKKPSELPTHAKDVGDGILEEVIGCAHEGKCTDNCTTAFRIIRSELEFYKLMNLPLPRLCPNCRHYNRIKRRNTVKHWYRKCQCGGEKSENGVYQNASAHTHGKDSCSNEFETNYSPERKEIIYCERCYQAEVS